MVSPRVITQWKSLTVSTASEFYYLFTHPAQMQQLLLIKMLIFCLVEYPVDSFDGKKYFVVSTANAFGGRNSFLGISYLVMGIICFIILAVFVYKKIIHLRTKG